MSIVKFIFGLAKLKKMLPESKTSLEKEFELDENEDDFASHFYDEVNNVIGGTNPNEKLTLLLPGIALAKSDFEYDYKNNAPKGSVIEANESRLANKLYDPFDMVGSDNGKTLEHQYRSALDMLTPKLNPIIANAKNQLRELLMKPFPYKFGPKNIMRAEILKSREKSDKTTEYYFENAPADKVEADANSEEELKTYTFQEVFFRLYNDYVEQLGEWANERQRRKDYYVKCAKANLELTTESQKNKQSENDYLQWYENNGESWLTAVNQKLSVLLSVFSATDMKIVEGILDSGSGAELQEARQTLNNTRKINPDGGYIYPVKFNPTNWFEYLDTSFTPVDLLNTPTAILDELKILYNRKDYICSRITDIAAEVNANSATIDAKRKAVDEAKAKYIKDDDALQNAMEDSFGDFAKFVTKAICSACAGSSDTDTKDKIKDAVSTAAGQKQEEADSKIKELFEVIGNIQKDPYKITIPDNIKNSIEPVSKMHDSGDVKIKDEKEGKEKTVSHRDAAISLLEKITSKNIDDLNKNISDKVNSDYTEAKIGNDATKQEQKDTLTAAVTSVNELSKAIDNVKNTDTKKNTETKLGEKPQKGSPLEKAAKSYDIAGTITGGIDVIFEGSKKVNAAQSSYVNSISEYTNALCELTSAENLDKFKLQLGNLKIDQNNVDSKIKVLEAKLSQVNNFEQCFSDSVNPPAVPDGFTQFNIVHTVSNTSSQSKSEEKTTVSSTTAGFWIFKSKKRSVHTESHIESLCKSNGTEIEIGMNVAKVGIEREWFNPGVFALTGEMYNVAEKTEKAKEDERIEFAAHGIKDKEPEDVLRISHGADLDNQEHMLNLSHDVFPCYPTAMVIARDVTIKLTTTSNSDYSKLDEATDEVSKSKAFFVYNAGDGSRTHTSNAKCKTKSNSRAITIRFTTPQVIGFYQQIVPKDVSTPYPKDKTVNEENSIVKFIEAYENVIKRRLDAENAV